MFGFKRKKKDNPVVSGTKFPKTLGVPASVPVLNSDFMEDSSHIKEVGLKIPGRTNIVIPSKELQYRKTAPRLASKKTEARYLFTHVNHLTGKTHTVDELVTLLKVSKRTVYKYLEGLPKKKKREYNAKRG